MISRLVRFDAALLLAIGFLIVLHAPLSVWLGVLFPEQALYIKAWKEVLLAVALLLTLIIAYQTRRRIHWHRDVLVWLACVYAAVHILSLATWQGVQPVVAGLMIDLRYIAYFTMVYVLVRAYSRYRSAFVKVFAAGAALVIGFACLQTILPRDTLTLIGYGESTIAPYQTVDQNEAYVRYGSTLRGPNPMGAYVVMVCAIAIAWATYRRERISDWKWWLGMGTVLLALYVSYSRSAWIAVILASTFIIVYRFWKSRMFWYMALLGLVFAAIIGLFAAMTTPDAFSTNVLHKDPRESGAFNSDDARRSSLVSGINTVLTHPFGTGIGSTGSASLLGSESQIVENQYLMIAREVGWLGLLIFLMLFAVVMSRLWKQRSEPLALGMYAAGIGMTVIGLVLPVWADDTVSIVWWGMTAAIIAGGKDGSK